MHKQKCGSCLAGLEAVIMDDHQLHLPLTDPARTSYPFRLVFQMYGSDGNLKNRIEVDGLEPLLPRGRIGQRHSGAFPQGAEALLSNRPGCNPGLLLSSCPVHGGTIQHLVMHQGFCSHVQKLQGTFPISIPMISCLEIQAVAKGNRHHQSHTARGNLQGSQ